MHADFLSPALHTVGAASPALAGSAAAGSAATAAGGSFSLGSLSSAPPFSDLLASAMSNVQGLEDQAAGAVQGLMSGSGVDVHQAMIATQKSDMAFEMALAVRNKAVAAYQQVMQMQF
jgi:flagellar hook-basal body complex protein FliE